ncbi:hypothetical protein FM042_08410 [Aliidiomarina halalkaliphila]|uniref:Uncharacterized protein n=1 Tax=Aliidiomarina halalkaliphila TaxID=2593535 RepID=A0A552X1V4_9GAMM|nr:hypothetical protein [Aliidiomarina halalkaliphila]TRW48994.1 hypothetical protein FM042_08410 [Aliidiomarina halalkaliphila]
MLRGLIFFFAGVALIFLILSIIAQRHFSMTFPTFTKPNAPVREEIHESRSVESASESATENEVIVASGELYEDALEVQDEQRKHAEATIDQSIDKELSIHEIIELNIALLANIESSSAFQHHRLLTYAIHDFGDTTIHALVCSGSRCSGLFRTNSDEQSQRLAHWLIFEQDSLGFIRDGQERVFVEDGMHFVHVVLATDPNIGLPHQ